MTTYSSLSRTYKLGVFALFVYLVGMFLYAGVTITAIAVTRSVPEDTMENWGFALMGLAILGACVAGAQGLRHLVAGGNIGTGIKGMVTNLLGKVTAAPDSAAPEPGTGT